MVRDREGIVAARVPRDFVSAMDELVKTGSFKDRSEVVRKAIQNLLEESTVGERRLAQPAVNRTNTSDSTSESMKEEFSL